MTAAELQKIVQDYIAEISSILSNQQKIEEAVRNAELVQGKPTLSTIRDQLQKRTLNYTNENRAKDERERLHLTSLSTLEAIIFASVYFEAGSNITKAYSAHLRNNPKESAEFSKLIESKLREKAGRELKNFLGFKDNNAYTLKDELTPQEFDAITNIVSLQLIVQRHLDQLKSKNPKHEDIKKIQRLLDILEDTKISAQGRINAVLKEFELESKRVSQPSAFFKKIFNSDGIYGLIEKIDNIKSKLLLTEGHRAREPKSTR